MFDFLKKSRAVKFLCSACLLCSLGSFAVSAQDASDLTGNSAHVGTAFVQANLGTGPKTITLKPGATIDMNGEFKDALLVWNAGQDESGNDQFETLENNKEDTELKFYFTEDDEVAEGSEIKQVAAARHKFGGNFSLNNLQLRDAPGGLGDEPDASAEDFKPEMPCRLKVWALVTTPGSTSLIAGPNEAVESSPEG